MKLYGNPMSTCTRKVLMTAAEKGEKFDFQVLDFAKGDHKSPENMARQPFGQVPAIDDDGFMMFESRAIIRYLDEKWTKGPQLTPADVKARAVMNQWISVESEDFAKPAMMIVSEKLMKPMRGGTPDQERIQTGIDGVKKCVAVMETQLAKTAFIAGDSFTLADICFMPYIQYLFVTGDGELITSQPHVSAWWTKISTRPTWKAIAGN